MTPGYFGELLLQICERHNASVTSWKRSKAHNLAVGGRPDSRHLEGLGADLVLDDPHELPLLITHAANLGLAAFWDVDHVHIQTPHAQGTHLQG